MNADGRGLPKNPSAISAFIRAPNPRPRAFPFGIRAHLIYNRAYVWGETQLDMATARYTLAERFGYLARKVKTSRIVAPRTEEDRNMRWLYLNTALVGVPSGGIVAFLPVFLARLGVSSTVMSWFTALPALLTIAAMFPGAMVAERNADQVAVRCKYMRIQRTGFLVCALAPFFVPTAYLPAVLIVVWMIRTFPETVAIPAWTSVMSRAVSPQMRPVLNGTRWAMLSLVSALSSAFFGWMLDHVAFPLNYQLVVFISFVVGWFDPVAFARIVVPPLEVLQSDTRLSLKQRLREYVQPIIEYKPFLIYLAATIGYRLALNLPAPLFSLYWVNQLHAPDTLIGLRGTVGNGALVLGYLFWGRIARKIGHRKVLTFAALGFALYPIATALIPSAIWLLAVAVIWGLTVGGIDVGLFDMMLHFCPQQRQPRFAAVYQIVANLAIFVGPLLGAALARATSINAALIIAGAAQIVMTIPFLVLPKDV